MTKPFALQPILELMQTRADDATRHLATLIAAEQDARSKLQMLQEYRDEYAARFRAAAQNGLGQREWRNYQEFLDRLDEAVGHQRDAVTRQEQQTAAGQNAWQQQRQKLKAFETLSHRHTVSEVARDQKRDQKTQDEFAARRGGDDDEH